MSRISARLFSYSTAMVDNGAGVIPFCIIVLSISDELNNNGATVYMVLKTLVDAALPLVLVLCLMCSPSCWCYF